MSMSAFLERAVEVLRHAPSLFGIGGDRSALDSVAAVQSFVATRSAYIAQKTLYGYVKTRMGTRHIAMFDDKAMIASLNIARNQLFAACLSDLTIYAVGVSMHDLPPDNEQRVALAQWIYETSIADNAGNAPPEFDAAAVIAAFAQRAAATEWRVAAARADNFTASPVALYRWAPIADNLKRLDREIVENSVTFAWRDVREQFNKRLSAARVAADWAARPSN